MNEWIRNFFRNLFSGCSRCSIAALVVLILLVGFSTFLYFNKASKAELKEGVSATDYKAELALGKANLASITAEGAEKNAGLAFNKAQEALEKCALGTCCVKAEKPKCDTKKKATKPKAPKVPKEKKPTPPAPPPPAPVPQATPVVQPPQPPAPAATQCCTPKVEAKILKEEDTSGFFKGSKICGISVMKNGEVVGRLQLGIDSKTKNLRVTKMKTFGGEPLKTTLFPSGATSSCDNAQASIYAKWAETLAHFELPNDCVSIKVGKDL